MNLDVLELRAHLTRHIHVLVFDFDIVEYMCNIYKTFCRSAEHGQLDTIKYLISIGVDVQSWDNYAIRYAADRGHLDTVKYLVSMGADVHSCNNDAFIWAAYFGQLDTVKYLVSIGACDKFTIRWAIKNGHRDTVAYLKSLNKCVLM